MNTASFKLPAKKFAEESQNSEIDFSASLEQIR